MTIQEKNKLLEEKTISVVKSLFAKNPPLEMVDKTLHEILKIYIRNYIHND